MTTLDAIDAPAPAPDHASTADDRTLVVADAETNESLLEIPVTEGDDVTLAYTHSVDRTDVEDVYAVDGTDLRMDRTVFSSYGAGLPSEAEVERTDDGFVVSVDRSFERIYVAPGSVAGHVLRVDDRCYDLVERSGGSTVVLFVDDREAETGSVPGPSNESADRPDECEECP